MLANYATLSGMAKKVGRPPLRDGEKLSRRVFVKLTDAQYRALKKKADKRGVTVAELAREILTS